MSILCSDKTGTLTTAKISIHADSVYLCGSFSKEDLALYAGEFFSMDLSYFILLVCLFTFLVSFWLFILVLGPIF
jgi:hypothetical protein